LNGRKQTVHHCLSCFGDVLKLSEKPDVIAVDIPIGLLDQAVRGGRDCDRGARSLLGHPRSSSVFSPPVRSALAYMTFATASAANRTSSPHQVGITQQGFALFPKLRDIDGHLTPRLQQRVREVHPELCFYELNQQVPMSHKKKS